MGFDKMYKLTISEPWDFTSETGNNYVKGIVVRELNTDEIIFKSKELVKINGVEGKLILLKSRYMNEHLKNANGYSGTVGGAIILGHYDEKIDKKKIIENSKYVLIGDISSL